MNTLGIDVGGSGIKGAIVDIEAGQLVSERIRLVTPDPSTPKAVAKVVKKLVKKLDYQGPAGAGFPGVMLHGVCYTAANIDASWININVERVFQEETGNPFYVANDADVAGLAEVRFGAAKDFKGVVLVITLGTGIGTAIFNDGVLLPNLEFGHLQIREKDAEKRASAAVKVKKDLNWKEWAACVEEYIRIMENLFWPDIIIIGGGISRNHAKFFPYINVRTKIVPAQLYNQAGIIGAALYASIHHSFNAS
ncbi:MAG: ROK family protein [Anaerolineaceae bacterium]